MDQEKLLKSVVRIHAYGRPVDCAKPFLTADRFKGVGTGFFIDPPSPGNLYILTCSHVVEGADTVTIMIPLLGMSENPASVLAMLPSYDLAVVVVTGGVAADLKDKTSPLELGASDGLQLGQKLVAVGYPLGQSAIKVSDGVYSGFQTKLQHTVSISPGNSGGPLINEASQVVGVNSSGIVSPEASNIGFAVPIEMYLILSKPVFENSPGPPGPQRVVRQPTFGFKFSPITMSHARLIGSCVGDHGGVQIVSVVTGTDMATHLSPGDILVEFDGKPIDTIGEVQVPWNYQKVKLQDLLARSVEDREYPIKYWDASAGSCATAGVKPNMAPSNALRVLYPPHDQVPYLTALGLVIMPLLGNHSQCPALIQTYVPKSTEELAAPCLVISHVFNGTLAQIEGPLNAGDEVAAVNGVAVKTLEDVRGALPKFTEVNGHKAITLKSRDGKLLVVNCLDALQCEEAAKAESLYSPDPTLLESLSITRTQK
jgi:S1-C subfamily serine protease